MKKVSVRCWKVKSFRAGKTLPDHLFVTYPESDSGHDLITCLNCGEIYAVTIVKEVYVGPSLDNKVKGINCISCGLSLDRNYAKYPETYVVDGERHSYAREVVLPDDNQSIVKEFYGIYE